MRSNGSQITSYARGPISAISQSRAVIVS